VVITDTQVREAVLPSLKIITEGVRDTIESTPPELVSDIYERGVILSGGASLLKGLDKLIRKKINISVYLVDDPSTAVIRGMGLVLEDFDNLKSVIIPSARD
jgi:rod shape-determining protein MreB